MASCCVLSFLSGISDRQFNGANYFLFMIKAFLLLSLCRARKGSLHSRYRGKIKANNHRFSVQMYYKTTPESIKVRTLRATKTKGDNMLSFFDMNFFSSASFLCKNTSFKINGSNSF